MPIEGRSPWQPVPEHTTCLDRPRCDHPRIALKCCTRRNPRQGAEFTQRAYPPQNRFGWRSAVLRSQTSCLGQAVNQPAIKQLGMRSAQP